MCRECLEACGLVSFFVVLDAATVGKGCGTDLPKWPCSSVGLHLSSTGLSSHKKGVAVNAEA